MAIETLQSWKYDSEAYEDFEDYKEKFVGKWDPPHDIDPAYLRPENIVSRTIILFVERCCMARVAARGTWPNYAEYWAYFHSAGLYLRVSQEGL